MCNQIRWWMLLFSMATALIAAPAYAVTWSGFKTIGLLQIMVGKSIYCTMKLLNIVEGALYYHSAINDNYFLKFGGLYAI